MPVLIHTADVHLGRSFPKLGRAGRIQRERMRQAFASTCRLARETGADGVLIAGDLFDSARPSERDASFALGELRKLAEAGIFTAICPGTHDCGAQPYTAQPGWAGELAHVFNEAGTWRPPGAELAIHADPEGQRPRDKSPIAALKPDEEAKYNIALAHGSLLREGKVDPTDSVFTTDELERSGMDYIALGHWHNTLRCPCEKTEAWYSGAPEMIALDETGSGNVLIVELDEDRVSVTPQRVGRTRVDRKEIDLSGVADRAQLERMIQEDADENLVRIVTLKGLAGDQLPVDAAELEEACGDSFMHLIVHDRSHPAAFPLDDTAAGHTVIGRFERLMRERMDAAADEVDKAVARRALQYGLALLTGRKIF